MIPTRFHASLLKIGTWEYHPKNKNDLVGKIFYQRRRFVWEMFHDDGFLKSKMEIKWSDIYALKATYDQQNSSDILELMLLNPPRFCKEPYYRPGKRAIWESCSDFTTTHQASTFRRHYIKCGSGWLIDVFGKMKQQDTNLFDSLVERSNVLVDDFYQPTFSDVIRESHSPIPMLLADNQGLHHQYSGTMSMGMDNVQVGEIEMTIPDDSLNHKFFDDISQDSETNLQNMNMMQGYSSSMSPLQEMEQRLLDDDSMSFLEFDEQSIISKINSFGSLFSLQTSNDKTMVLAANEYDGIANVVSEQNPTTATGMELVMDDAFLPMLATTIISMKSCEDLMSLPRILSLSIIFPDDDRNI